MKQNDRFKFRVAIFDKMANDEWEFEKFGKVGYYIEESGRLYMLTINQFGTSNIYLNQDFNSPTAGRCFKVVNSTGLKDKNGNLIYEGDIVKWFLGTGDFRDGTYKRIPMLSYVFYHCQSAGFLLKTITSDGNNNFTGIDNYDILGLSETEYQNYLSYHGIPEDRAMHKVHLEIIGNIYENPELLK